MGQAMDDLIKQPSICHRQPLAFTTVIRHSQYCYGLSFDHGENSMEATTKNSNWNTGKNTQILAAQHYRPSDSSSLAQQSPQYCPKNFSFADDAQLASNRSRIASLASHQANNITNSPLQGAAYAIHGDIMAGVTKRTANSLSFGTLFPTTLTNSEHASIFNKVRSLYGGDNTIQNTADIDAHAETPLFGSETFTLGDVSTTSEVSSAILGGAQLLKSVPKLASAIKDLGSKEVQIWGFRGGKGDTRSSVLNNPDPNVRAEAYTGHIGVSLDKGKTIYGFGPKVSSNETKMDVISNLKNHQTYSGVITDDSTLFRDVVAGKYDPSNAPPINLYVMTTKTPPDVMTHLNRAVNQREISGVRYGFPEATHPTETVRNCATAFGECGLSIPSKDGKLINYIPAMQDQGAKKIR
ncbi:MAG: hypothetical protein RL122_664 [Pseudomonadota bacterium]